MGRGIYSFRKLAHLAGEADTAGGPCVGGTRPRGVGGGSHTPLRGCHIRTQAASVCLVKEVQSGLLVVRSLGPSRARDGAALPGGIASEMESLGQHYPPG